MRYSVLLLFVLLTFSNCVTSVKPDAKTPPFYDFKVKNSQGEEIEMDTYREKVVLVVNTASKCGFTPQFAELEDLYKRHKESGLVILGFPCNQFAGQDPGTNDEIRQFCQVNFGVTFPMFAKIDVNGEKAATLFKFLKNELKGTFGNSIKWNFTKFLIDRKGNPVKRYAPNVKPSKIEEDILIELNK